MRKVYNIIEFKTNSVEWFSCVFFIRSFVFLVSFVRFSFFFIRFFHWLLLFCIIFRCSISSFLHPPPQPNVLMLTQMLLNSFYLCLCVCVCVCARALSFEHCTLFVFLRCRWLFFFVSRIVLTPASCTCMPMYIRFVCCKSECQSSKWLLRCSHPVRLDHNDVSK